MQHLGFRLGTAALLATAGGAAEAGPASADTAIAAPSVASGVVWYTNTAYAFTFTEPAGATAVSFGYSVNGAAAQSVPAVDNSAQVSLQFPGSYNTLAVYAVAAAGTVSAATTVTVQPDDNVWAADKDLNGDGLADLLTAGGTGTGLPDGIWQAPGTGGGQLTTPAVDIGAGLNEPAGYFDGGQFIAGHYRQDGFEDIIAYEPGAHAGTALELTGSGDGSALNPDAPVTVVQSAWLADPLTGDAPLQITNGYDATGIGNRMDGLFSTSGDATHGYTLDYIEAYAVGFSPIQLTGQPTPDGTTDWSQWRIAGDQVSSGIALYLWNQSTGALYLWEGINVVDNGNGTGTVTYTQYEISPAWHPGKDLITLEAANFAGSAAPGLWTVNAKGIAHAYDVSDLSTTQNAKISRVAKVNLTAAG